MLTKDNYSPNRIRELQARYGKDPILLERMLFAFGLLESLVMVDMPFLFKGGSCLMLLMDEPRRLSTDIDILVKPGTNVEDYILQDIIRSSVCIAGKKKYDPAEYPFYIQGSQSLDSHILSGRFNGEIAAEYACRVMYIAACLLKEIPVVPLNHTENYVNEKIDNSYYARLSHMCKQNLEAYAYLIETVRLLTT